MLSTKIIVSLTDYLFANEGIIDPSRKVEFQTYSSGVYSSNSPLVEPTPFSSVYSTTVTNVSMCDGGYKGIDKDGKEMIVAENCATIDLPLSILKGA